MVVCLDERVFYLMQVHVTYMTCMHTYSHIDTDLPYMVKWYNWVYVFAGCSLKIRSVYRCGQGGKWTLDFSSPD